MTERIFESEALTKGWEGIEEKSIKNWGFDTSEIYANIHSLDRNGIPIYWDDYPYTVDDVRGCTGEDVCCLILSHGKTKVLVIVHRDLPNVMMYGRVTKEIPWAEYTAVGFWAIKKHLGQGQGQYKLDAALFNPTVATLERYKVLKSIIQKFVKDAKLIEGGADESTGNENGDGQDKAGE